MAFFPIAGLRSGAFACSRRLPRRQACPPCMLPPIKTPRLTTKSRQVIDPVWLARLASPQTAQGRTIRIVGASPVRLTSGPRPDSGYGGHLAMRPERRRPCLPAMHSDRARPRCRTAGPRRTCVGSVSGHPVGRSPPRNGGFVLQKPEPPLANRASMGVELPVTKMDQWVDQTRRNQGNV